VLRVFFYPVAAKKTLEHPLVPLPAPGRWALGLGIATFLVGVALTRWRMIHRIAWERLAAAAITLAVAVALDRVDAIVAVAIVVAVLVSFLAVETARLREVRVDMRR